jgi:hypothetical protein
MQLLQVQAPKLCCFAKVKVPKSNIAIIWTPIYDWYVVRCGSKNRHLTKCVFKRN